MIMIIGEITTKGREDMMKNIMIMMMKTTMTRMREDREVVAQATENQGRTMDIKAEEATKTVEVEIAEEEEITIEVETVGEKTNMIDMIDKTNKVKTTQKLMSPVKLKMRKGFFT